MRLRGSGAGVYYGRRSRHNSVIPIQGAAQGAQRAEIRAALRWALWAWNRTVYITDSQQVKDGIEAILQGKKKKQKSHRDLWRRIAVALHAKGLENHRVEKVKAHQSKKQRHGETLKQKSARERNEEADKRAVEAAARNAAPSQLAEKRKKVVKIGKLIQTMMLQIMEKRGQIMKTWGHSASNDAAAFRILEARRSDNLRELIEKESERKQENEREAVPVEELRGDRTVVFPLHTWEPRTDTGVKPYQELTEPEILTRDEWPHPNSLWRPIVWCWRTMQWKGEFSEEDEIRLGGKCTPWLYLAFDFRAATMEKVTKMVRAEGEETLASLARTFHLASRRMLQRCQHKEKHKEMKHVATMRGLDLPVCRGIDKIVILKKPEALNRFLHELAIKMCSGVEKRSWQIKVDLPDTGLPLFHESLPQTLRRRIEGKQAQLPRERERARPSHAASHGSGPGGRNRRSQMGKNDIKIENKRSKTSTPQQNSSRKRLALVSSI